MTSLVNRLANSVASVSYKPQLGSLRDQVGDFVASVQEDLGVLDELRYEWRRLQTFVDWPLDLPRPSELAKAGFFFTPTEDTPDRCAHFCTDKFFSAWEAGDDPWEVLRDNCPDCPFVVGSSNNVPLPSAYVAHASEEEGREASRRAHADLGQYLSQAVQRVAGAAGAGGRPEGEGAAGGGGGGGGGGRGGGGGFGEGEGGGLTVTSKKKKGRRGAGGKGGRGGGGGGGEDEVYGRVWSAGGAGSDEFPSAVVGGEESEGVDTPRMAVSREEWERIGERVAAAIKSMQGQWEQKIGGAEGRVGRMREQVEAMAAKAERLGKQDWLAPKHKEIAAVDAELREKQEKAGEAHKELESVMVEVERNKEELAKLKEAETLKEEWERKVREASEEVEELQDSKGSLEGEISELEDHKQQLLDEAEAEKERIRESMSSLKGAKKEAEADMVEVQDNIERRRKELEMLEAKLKDWGRKEEVLVSKQTDLEAREDELKRKEAQLKSREEWLLQKEGEQRAASERRKLTPRREGLAPIDQALEQRLVEAEEEEDMESKREELLDMMVM